MPRWSRSISTERSDQIYGRYFEASQKFDYFVTGVALALVSYVGASFEPAKLCLNPPLLEFGSVVAFLLSAFAGLKNLESHVELMKTMFRRLYEEEVAGSLARVAISGRAVLNESTGDVIPPEKAEHEMKIHQAGAQILAEQLEAEGETVGFWYRIRNYSLMAGFVALLSGRLLSAYV